MPNKHGTHSVMAGLDPAIHAVSANGTTWSVGALERAVRAACKPWVPGSSPGRTVLLAAAGFLMMSLLSVTPAYAHAFLKTASPPVGGTVHHPPSTVTINFTETVEPAFCSMVVTDRDGKNLVTGGLETGSDGAQLVARVKPLNPGSYMVRWKAMSTDTHKTEGIFRFTVAR